MDAVQEPPVAPTVKSPSEVVFDGKTYVFPELDAESLIEAITEQLKSLRLNPMDVVIERYDELKGKPELLDRLLDRALRAKAPPAPTREEVLAYMNSFEGRVWTIWWSLHKSYPELTIEKAQGMLIHEGVAMASREIVSKTKDA